MANGNIIDQYRAERAAYKDSVRTLRTNIQFADIDNGIHTIVITSVMPSEGKSLTSITLVFLSAFLTGAGIYGRIAKSAGAGTLVPITGFANAVVSPALEFKTEGYILGVGAKIFIIAGPVIVYGLAASVIYGVILYITQLF